MGWKASFLIIHRPERDADELLLTEIGFRELKKIEDDCFESVIDPEDNRVHIGSYQNNIIICDSNIPLQFFEEGESETELRFKQLFPDSEICAIILHSAVNLWGYAVIMSGTKVRARAGSADDGTFVEFGQPLAEEEQLFSKSTRNESGERVYAFDDFPNELFSEDQVGENFVFRICNRYFGDDLDCANEQLFQTNFISYKYSGISKESPNNISKPWWKFW